MADDDIKDNLKSPAMEKAQESPSFGIQRGHSPRRRLVGPKQIIDETSSEGTDVEDEQILSEHLNDDGESLAESMTSTSKVNVDVVNLCLHKVLSENLITLMYLNKVM